MSNEQRLYFVPWALIGSGTLAKLKPSACKVFLSLLAHDGPNGIFPTVPTLARECDLDERVVMDAVEQLENLRLFEVTRTRGKRNRYNPLPPQNVPSLNVGTKNVGTSDAGTVPTENEGGVPTKNEGLTLSSNTNQEMLSRR